MAIQKKQPDHYLSLNYRIEIERDDEGDYVATVPLLPGCIADGATAEEAAAHVEDAKAEWIAARLEANLPIPEPQVEFSGRWVVRTTTTLHRKIAECAERESVSINQFVNNVLAEAVGSRQVFATIASQNCKVFLDQGSGGVVRMCVTFGNLVSGGVFWKHGLLPSGQNELAPKSAELIEAGEMRA